MSLRITLLITSTLLIALLAAPIAFISAAPPEGIGPAVTYSCETGSIYALPGSVEYGYEVFRHAKYGYAYVVDHDPYENTEWEFESTWVDEFDVVLMRLQNNHPGWDVLVVYRACARWD